MTTRDNLDRVASRTVSRVAFNRARVLIASSALGMSGGHAFAQDAATASPPPPSVETIDGGEIPDFTRADRLYGTTGTSDRVGSFSPGEGPEATIDELDDVERQRRAGMVDPGPLAIPFDRANELFIDIENEIGLRFAMAYTMLFQRASGGPGRRHGGSGDLDFMSSWTLLGRETGNIGRLVFTGEYRHDIGNAPANALGGTLGVLTNTTGGFNDRGWVVRDAFWLQHLADGRIRLLIGRADPSDYVGGNPLQSINNSFSNRALSANASVGFPAGHTFSAGASVSPADFLYATFGASNAVGDSRRMEFSSLFDEWDLFYFAELGFTPTIDGLGSGRYAVLGWYTDDRPKDDLDSDQGISIIAQQQFGPSVLAFLRYSYADATLQGIRHQLSGAVGFNGLLGDPQNMTGIGGSWGEPRVSGRDDEKVIEAFHRFQLTRFTQLSFGIQGIFDPSDSDADAIAVFTGRVRIAF